MDLFRKAAKKAIEMAKKMPKLMRGVKILIPIGLGLSLFEYGFNEKGLERAVDDAFWPLPGPFGTDMEMEIPPDFWIRRGHEGNQEA